MLFDEIKRLNEISETVFNDYLKAYVLLIAISLQGEKDSRKYIEKFSKTDFRWAKEISEILISERIETTIVNFEYKPKIKISEG